MTIESIVNAINEINATELFKDASVGKKAVYRNQYQNKSLNAVSKTSTKDYKKDLITRSYETLKDDVLILFEDVKNFRLEVPTLQVLDYIVGTATRQITYGETDVRVLDKQRIITVTLDDYMDLRGLKDRKEAAAQLRREVNILFGMKLEWDEQRGKRKKAHFKMHLIGSTGDTLDENDNDPVKNGMIRINIDIDAAKLIALMPVMPFPESLVKIRSNHAPHAYYLARAMLTHHNMNYEKGNAHVMKVETLVKCCPNMPKIDPENRDRNNHKIKEAFEHDLDAITDPSGKSPQPQILKEWYYTLAGEAVLAPRSFKEWLQLSVHFELVDFPDQTGRIKEKKKQLVVKARKAPEKKPATEPSTEQITDAAPRPIAEPSVIDITPEEHAERMKRIFGEE